MRSDIPTEAFTTDPSRAMRGIALGLIISLTIWLLLFLAIGFASAQDTTPVETTEGFFGDFLALIGLWLIPVMGVVTAATAVTALTPTTSDDKALNFILSILNFLAGNFLKNENADSRSTQIKQAVELQQASTKSTGV